MEKEIWKDVRGYEGIYQISSLGRVKTLLYRKAKACYPKESMMTPKMFGEGYIQVGFRANGVRKYFSIHRLVAIAFIPNPENKPEVNHKNGIRDDNRVENLEWCTTKENSDHRINVSKNVPNQKPITQYTIAGEFVANFESAGMAERDTGIDSGAISACVRMDKNRNTAGGYKWKLTELN